MDLMELFLARSIQSFRLFFISGCVISACMVLRLLRLEPRVSKSLISRSKGYCSCVLEKAVFPSGRIIRNRQYGSFSISISLLTNLRTIITIHKLTINTITNQLQLLSSNYSMRSTSSPFDRMLTFINNYIDLTGLAIDTMRLSRTKNHKSTPQILEQTYDQRQWLRKRGKTNRITFNEQMIDKLKHYFSSLDEDGSNSISPNELEDPLILFGICQNREEVWQLFEMLDIDGSGEMDFRQFLHVFRKVASEKKQGRICKKKADNNKIQDFTNTLLGIQGKIQQGISFRLGMSIYRRKHIINAIMSKNVSKREEGKTIMNKFQQQVTSNPLTRDKIVDPKRIAIDCLPSLPKRPISQLKTHRRLKTTAI